MSVSRIAPTSYWKPDWVTITNPNNMLTDTTSATYGVVPCDLSDDNVVYLYGFDLTSIPVGASIISFRFRFKTDYMYPECGAAILCDVNGNTIWLNSFYDTSTTVDTYTCSNINPDPDIGELSWNTLVQYNNSTYVDNWTLHDGLAIAMLMPPSSTVDHVDVYGADIEVTYALAGSEPQIYNLILPARKFTR